MAVIFQHSSKLTKITLKNKIIYHNIEKFETFSVGPTAKCFNALIYIILFCLAFRILVSRTCETARETLPEFWGGALDFRFLLILRFFYGF